jgi:CheY-like chemotaxis protein
MRITLERHGAVVRSVGDARSAIREHAEWKPDAVVTDLGMPDIDGTTMLFEIRRREPAIRAIAVTAYAGREAREHALAAGFNGFISKPFAPNDLVLAIEQLWS